jgi:hypothetical protein
MTRRTALLLTLSGSIFLLNSAAQNPKPPAPDPFRNFIGRWSGTVLINPDNGPPEVKVTISEQPDKKAMTWEYIFGQPGAKGYVHDFKVMTLSPKWKIMTMQWKGKPKSTFSTAGLDDFASDGYGTFVGTQLNTQSNLPNVDWNPSRLIIKLQPSKLIYLWESTDHGKTHIDSEFSFDRVPDPAEPQSKP